MIHQGEEMGGVPEMAKGHVGWCLDDKPLADPYFW